MSEREYSGPSKPEKDKELEIEVACLGRVLEGEGKIASTLEDGELEAFGVALKKSIGRVEQPECAACLDGRCRLHQADGSSPRLRPRKAGASLSSLATAGIGSDKHLAELEKCNSAEEVFEYSGQLQRSLGNQESAHVGCGAAGGFIEQSRAVSQLDPAGPTVSLVQNIMSREAPDKDSGRLIERAMKRAGKLAGLLERVGWSGQKFEQHVAAKNPAGVEILETKDDEVHGHAEDAVVIIDGPVDDDGRPLYTLDDEELFRLSGRRVFPVNLAELRRDGAKLADPAEGLVASLLHHLGGVYYKLGDGSHPLFVITIR